MESILSWVLLYSAMYGVDPKVALAIIEVESNYNPSAVGSSGEIGLMQLSPKYFPVRRKQLFDAKTNIQLGIKHLAESKRKCKHKTKLRYVVCYNVGVFGGSKIKHPDAFPYYVKVMKALGGTRAKDFALQISIKKRKGLGSGVGSKTNYSQRQICSKTSHDDCELGKQPPALSQSQYVEQAGSSEAR